MKVPQVKLLDFKDVGEEMGGEEQMVVGIYLAVEGDITGSIMFILEHNAGKSLVSKLMGTPPAEGDFSDMEISAMKEIGLFELISTDHQSQNDSVNSRFKY